MEGRRPGKEVTGQESKRRKTSLCKARKSGAAALSEEKAAATDGAGASARGKRLAAATLPLGLSMDMVQYGKVT